MGGKQRLETSREENEQGLANCHLTQTHLILFELFLEVNCFIECQG